MELIISDLKVSNGAFNFKVVSLSNIKWQVYTTSSRCNLTFVTHSIHGIMFHTLETS